MNDEYKYWVFYVGKDIYAYTDDKELAKQFEKERNMEVFKKCKKELQRGSVNYLADNYQNNMLEHLKGTTKIAGIGSEVTDFDIAITKEEQILVMNMAVHITEQQIPNKCWTSPTIFLDNYRALLDKVGYTTKWLKVRYGKQIKVIQEDIDYLEVFLELFGHFMKE